MCRRALPCADPPAWSRCMGILNRMPNNYSVTPTATTYNMLLAKCADDNELERAEELIDRMVRTLIHVKRHILSG